MRRDSTTLPDPTPLVPLGRAGWPTRPATQPPGNQGNLLVVDATSGAKLFQLATGTPGTITNLTDGAVCKTTLALYQGDAWCSDANAKVRQLVGAAGL